MQTKFHDKYRIKSTRLTHHDYSSLGMYFITICTKNRKHFFGEIENNTMKLSEMGTNAYKYWEKIPTHFPHVELDECMVMPNHIHGILSIKNQKNPSPFFLATTVL